MPELYQIIGAVLRDVSQARFTSDLYSRQISLTYENDSLLRCFPVPRAEIDEVEFNLPFVVKEVTVDPSRHQSRNAAIGRIFDDYSLRIVRAGLVPVQEAFETATKDLAAEPKELQVAAGRFEKTILSDAFRVTLHGRLLRFLTENVDDLLSKKEDGPFDMDKARERLRKVITDIKDEPEVAAVASRFPALAAALSTGQNAVERELKLMAAAVNEAYQKYPDYSVEVDIEARTLQSNPAAASYIKVKAAVKNYRWSKVDVDSKEMRNLRTLLPE